MCAAEVLVVVGRGIDRARRPFVCLLDCTRCGTRVSLTPCTGTQLPSCSRITTSTSCRHVHCTGACQTAVPKVQSPLLRCLQHVVSSVLCAATCAFERACKRRVPTDHLPNNTAGCHAQDPAVHRQAEGFASAQHRLITARAATDSTSKLYATQWATALKACVPTKVVLPHARAEGERRNGLSVSA